MVDDAAFLSNILAAPEDPLPRRAYADWLEDKGDTRAEYLRMDADRLNAVQQALATPDWERVRAEWEAKVEGAGKTLDRDWLAFMNSLGRPFAPHTFHIDAVRPPFSEPVGWRGDVITLESHFCSPRSYEPSLLTDLRAVCGQNLGSTAYGAGSFEIMPFLCELDPDPQPLTGSRVLRTLKAKNFRSNYIESLDSTYIPYPGYHPGSGRGVENDEIHNDFLDQRIFAARNGPHIDCADPFEGIHGKLKRAVADGQLWYVLLHTDPVGIDGRPGPRGPNEYAFSQYVILFAVGRSQNGDRLLGVVTQQVCHNLCD